MTSPLCDPTIFIRFIFRLLNFQQIAFCANQNSNNTVEWLSSGRMSNVPRWLWYDDYSSFFLMSLNIIPHRVSFPLSRYLTGLQFYIEKISKHSLCNSTPTLQECLNISFIWNLELHSINVIFKENNKNIVSTYSNYTK